jgi:arylsulfatase A-like enzyme
MWWPGHVPAQTTCQEFATTMDLMPTFAHLARGTVSGTEVPENGTVDGHDIAPLVLGQKDAKSPYESFCYYDQDQLQAIRSGPWKLFLPLKTFTKHPHFRKGEATRPLLFNVVTDVHSRTNVAEQNPDIVARLTKFSDAWRKELGDRGQRGDGQRSVGFLGEDTPPVPILKTTASSK